MRALLRTSFLAASLALCASAENTTANIGVPGLGVVYDSAHAAVRPVMGMPGAAVVGGAVSLDFTPSVVAGGGDLLLAASAEDGTVRAVRLRGQAAEAMVVARAITPQRMVFSPSGRTALLCDSKAAVVQVVTGLPDSPVAGNPVSLSELGSADAWKLAVSDDGSRVAIGAGTTLWLVDVAGNRSSIPLQAGVAATVFRPGTVEVSALLVTGEILSVLDGGVAPFGYIRGSAGLDAVGMQVSADGNRAFVSYAQGSLAVVEPGAAETNLINCGCTPSGLVPSGRPGMYRLNELSDGPLFLWDISGPLPRVWFVPDAAAGDAK